MSLSKLNRYTKLKKAGLCVDCGKVPSIEGQTKCKKCKEKAKKRNKKRRKNQKKKWKIQKSAL
jgi:hypothetical protein